MLHGGVMHLSMNHSFQIMLPAAQKKTDKWLNGTIEVAVGIKHHAELENIHP